MPRLVDAMDQYPLLTVFSIICLCAIVVGLYYAGKEIRAEYRRRARRTFRQCAIPWDRPR